MSDATLMTSEAENGSALRVPNSPLAIIGIGCLFPKAAGPGFFWANVKHGVDSITEVPPTHWNPDEYFDPDPKTPDMTYARRGGFLSAVEFNPLEFGIAPRDIEATDTTQLLGLVAAKQALVDAGVMSANPGRKGEGNGNHKAVDRNRVSVILGVTGTLELVIPLGARLGHPKWKQAMRDAGIPADLADDAAARIAESYVQWQENAFPGMLGNVVAGRIANRLDLGGTNCVVDAACASSLSALKMAISELLEYRCDMMLTGGVDTDNSIMTYVSFSKTPALSITQNSRPFDADSDGMLLGEGIGMLLLKRLEDAERDNDKIYAVIKGIGTSSDGRYKSIYAPCPQGQVRALRRAYEEAGFSPSSVSLIEAHGTGTMIGDPVEVIALKEVFGENNLRSQHIALGSVKSQIGHTKAAAGAASLIKTALALHHKVLPPTINITQPNPKFNLETSPFYLNTETRPWLPPAGEVPRRAGVSSFGFGGTNYHIVLEEYSSEHHSAYRLHSTAQSVLLFAPTPKQLLQKCEDTLVKLQSDTKERHYGELVNSCKSLEIPVTDARIGFVADSLYDACKLLQISIDLLRNSVQHESWEHPQGIYYRTTGIDSIHSTRKVVALFSGQGSQYLEMGKELVINLPCMREAYSYINNLLSKEGLQPLSELVCPAPVFNIAQRHAQGKMLERTEYAQLAIGVFSVGIYKILQQAGFKPDFVAGHSFGELTALWAAEVLSDEDYFLLAKARGQAMATPEELNFDPGAMLAVKGDVSKIEELVKNFPRVTIANWNSNHQVVLAGTKSEIATVEQTLKEQGYSTFLLPVSAAFHTPLIKHAQKPFAQAIEAITFKSAKIPVYTNVSGKCYPTEPKSTQKILKEHLINAVHFRDEIENIYADGGYFFIEFGPRNILTNLVKDILGDKPHLAVALNASRQKDSDRCLREAVVKLRVAGLPLKNLDPYQLDYKTSEKQKNNALSIRLNSVNYVSEKTQMAFEKALQCNHQVKLSTNTSKLSTVNASEVKPAPISEQQALKQNGHLVTNGVNHSIQTISRANTVDTKVAPISEQQTPKQNGHLVTNGVNHSIQTTSRSNTVDTKLAPISEQQAPKQNGYLVTNGVNHSIQPTSRSNTMNPSEAKSAAISEISNQQILESEKQSSPENPSNYQRILDGLEYGFIQFNQHQSEILHVHRQYLNNQMEYAKIFFQLMQQQNSLLLNGKSDNQQAQTTKIVVDSLERSMMQFHNHQAETLHIHKEYLKHQMEYSNNYFQLTRQQYSMLMADKSAHQRVVSNASTQDNANILSTTKQDSSTLSTTTADAVLTNGLGTSLYHSSSNGAKNGAGEEYKQEESGNTHNLSENEIAFTNGSQPLQDSLVTTEQTDLSASPSPLAIDLETLSRTLVEVVSEKTGYPGEMLELSMDIEADLGIDSIKRVEILGALQELFPDLPKPNNPEELAQLRTLGQIAEYMGGLLSETSQPESVPINLSPTIDVQQPSFITTSYPTSSNISMNGAIGTREEYKQEESENTHNLSENEITFTNGSQPLQDSLVTTEQTDLTPNTASPSPVVIDLETLSRTLVEVVSEKTGYPSEMLELSMDIEADLGIDSIKRVEILGALQELFPNLPQPNNPEDLAQLRTLGQIVEYIGKQAESAEKKTFEHEFNSQHSELNHNI